MLLWVRGRQIFGAGLLLCTMVGAVISHFLFIGPSAIPALILGVLAAIVAYSYKNQLNKQKKNTMNKQYLLPRILIGVMALIMLAVTFPSYFNPNMNPGLAIVTGDAVSLGQAAGAFLGRQMTVIIIALIGAFVGHRHLVLIGAFGMMFMNGHDAIFMGTQGGPASAAIGGLVFAIIAAVAIVLVRRNPA